MRSRTFLMWCAAFLLAASPEDRLHQHKVVSKGSPAPELGAENELIPSLVEGLQTKEDWYERARPKIFERWNRYSVNSSWIRKTGSGSENLPRPWCAERSGSRAIRGSKSICRSSVIFSSSTSY